MIAMYHRIIFLITGLFILNSPAADNFSIKGHIYDQSTEEPLSGANISIEQEQSGTTSDIDGYFAIPALPEGSYRLKISYIGYETAIESIELGSDTTISVYLTPVVLPVERITVTANRAEERRTPVAFSNMSRKNIEKRYWAQDIPMLLDELPNIHSYSDAGNGIG
ncbi:PEGA domain-containing protein, partial [candidate division KSB1 bacterium]|nr:PEGA domain-containing protein [candidate division KSB1 bacterium]